VFSVLWSDPRLYKEKPTIIDSSMRMFAILDKANPDIESIRGLNLAAIKHTTVQVTRLPF
jgi:hypothetical protein